MTPRSDVTRVPACMYIYIYVFTEREREREMAPSLSLDLSELRPLRSKPRLVPVRTHTFWAHVYTHMFLHTHTPHTQMTQIRPRSDGTRVPARAHTFWGKMRMPR
jgi:hypothetical protein